MSQSGIGTDLLMGINESTDMRQRYSYPTIYSAGGNIDARWHVEFYTYECTPPKRHRIRNSANHPTGINRLQDYNDRMEAINQLLLEVVQKLKTGWLPNKTTEDNKTQNTVITVCEALKYVVDMKQGYLGIDSFASFKNRIKSFTTWLILNNKSGLHPDMITSLDIIQYLNYLSITRKVKPRTRNNHLLDINAAFSYMEKIDPTWCTLNPCIKVDTLPSKSDRHELWTEDKLKKLSTYLKTNNINLYRFCLTFMLLGIRPKEAVRIQIHQINMLERTFLLPASHEKGSDRKMKRIFTTLYDELKKMDLHRYPDDYFLFTTKGKPGPNPTTRDFFTKQFTRAKHKINITQCTMYSLKHTFIILLFKNGENITNIIKKSLAIKR